MLEAVGERGKYKQKGTHTVVVGLPSQEALCTTELVDKLSALHCCLLLFPFKSQHSLSRLERCYGESVLVQSPSDQSSRVSGGTLQKRLSLLSSWL